LEVSELISYLLRWLDDQHPALENARVAVADFFNLPRPEGGYDVFYDYTHVSSLRSPPLLTLSIDRFLCALPPQLRTPWAQAYTRLAAPSALLITLQYPIDPDRTWGPPYAVSPELYAVLLGEAWEEVWARDVVREERRKRYGSDAAEPEGRERIAIFRRRQTR
jgi:hypothetical protein